MPSKGGAWHGALAKTDPTAVNNIVWTCDHFHFSRVVSRPLPNNNPHTTYSKYPHLMAARSCALTELQRRQREEKKQ